MVEGKTASFAVLNYPFDNAIQVVQLLRDQRVDKRVKPTYAHFQTQPVPHYLRSDKACIGDSSLDTN